MGPPSTTKHEQRVVSVLREHFADVIGEADPTPFASDYATWAAGYYYTCALVQGLAGRLADPSTAKRYGFKPVSADDARLLGHSRASRL